MNKSLVHIGTCPACGRLAPLVIHHDHAAPHGRARSELAYWTNRPQRSPRFPATRICRRCNSIDAAAKRLLDLPRDFSFMPEELWLIAAPSASWGVQQSVNRRAAEALVRVLRHRGLLPRSEEEL